MIDYLPLKRITAMHAEELHEAVTKVIDSGWYIRGETVTDFERQYASFIGSRHCIGVANGLDALTLILRSYIEMGRLREGDEVIVPANTYIATILSITENRLVPVLVEPRIDTLQIDDSLIRQAITPRTRAIMIVHLYGRCAFTPLIADLCRDSNLLLIEDNAQAHGCLPPPPSTSLSQPSWPSLVSGDIVAATTPRTGSLGHAAAHSFYPGKNLGAFGDAGAVTTDDDALADVLRSIANYGSARKYVFTYQGRNSRLDEIQAAVLAVKLKYLDADNARRRQIARFYIDNVQNPLITHPRDDNSVFHIYPVLCQQRDALQHFLADKGVQTVIHYPIPPHKQACYPDWHTFCLPITEAIHQQELSIPCHQAMTDAEVEYVVHCLNQFTYH
ncbi:MAG: DegT/DnrJ/EryC1/StrS family aminotransferase [Prevotella sp.]|nr:DegT/DnrJ/EryC1/StrS family aminotransferase [Prevotella sp.]